MSIETLDGMTFAAAAWLATYLMHSTLWLATAWLLVRVLRSPALAEWVWRAAVVGGLVTASLHGRIGGLDPAVTVHVAPPQPAPAVIAVEPAVTGLAQPGRPWGLEEVSSSAQDDASAPAQPGGVFGLLSAPPVAGGVRWYHAVTGLWFLGAAVALAHLVHRRRRLRRLLAHRRPVEGGPVAEALGRVRSAAGSARDVRLTTSPRLASPVALAGNEICVPERAGELGPRELETMLAHELAHLERRDPAWLRATSALERVLFPQPMNRLAARRLEEAAEYLCDERAVEWTGEGVALARCLHQVATWRGAGAEGASAMVRPASPLVSRVRRALEGGASASTGGQRAGVASWALAGLVLLACGGPGISAEERPAESSAAATREIAVMLPLPASTPLGEPSGEEWVSLDDEILRQMATEEAWRQAWRQVEQEVQALVDANRKENGGRFSPTRFDQSLNRWIAARAAETLEPSELTTCVALQGVLLISDAGAEWLEQESGRITYGMMVSTGPREGQPSRVVSVPSERTIAVSSWPRRERLEEPSTLEVLADGTVKAMFVLPMEGQPAGVTQAMGTEVKAGEDFPERIHKLLAYAASQMPRAPAESEAIEGLGYIGGDGAEETFPSSRVILKVHPGADFGTVLQILEACGKADVRIWNLAFEVDGADGPVIVEVPLPRDAVAVPEGEEPPARIELDVKVVKVGTRVEPETDEPWSGEGPFRFRGREVMYAVTDAGPKLGGGQIAMGGYVTEPGEVMWLLEQLRKVRPEAPLVVDASPGVVYGDLTQVIADARGAGVPVLFTGRLEGDK